MILGLIFLENVSKEDDKFKVRSGRRVFLRIRRRLLVVGF